MDWMAIFQLKNAKIAGKNTPTPAQPCLTNSAGSLDEHPLHAPSMSAGCVLVHALHPLSQAMFRRGALEGVKFYATPDHCEALTDQHAALVAAFPSALTPLTHAFNDTEADGIDPRTTRYLLVEGERSVELPSTARTIWLRTNGATGGTPCLLYTS